jgi:2-keto-4-pentenoate hydratase/2-oxohepta-3-ene-1,7-dioic acid hydratase in catechol pathway
MSGRDAMSKGSLREPAWRLTSIQLDSGINAAALQVGDIHVVPECLRGYSALMDVMRDWTTLRTALQSEDVAAAQEVSCRKVLMPLTYPNKVLCSGPNFRDHLAEMGESGLGDSWTPYFFLKPPTTALVADGAPVLVSGDEADKVDWEGELAAVIGVGGRDISVHDALDHVAGYAVANDVSFRGPFRRDTPAAPFQWDWVAQKAADTSLPFGPGIVPSWLVPDVQDLRITTLVNGVLKQDGSTADMVFGVADLVAFASSQITLEPGDVIATGTPAGVGAGRDEYLHPGDVVEVSIEGIGNIRNPIQRRESR